MLLNETPNSLHKTSGYFVVFFLSYILNRAEAACMTAGKVTSSLSGETPAGTVIRADQLF